ncbi:MAG: Bifunctional oligoribonuclease and PAP phosphatase NrnA [Firmicutes bacterium ADurb.Bin506]|jgi:phosphoesterase RecJ-like protein|nr:MAG: Bifunctional oligoribonuclease and PAP phosphatase NrnA [Firmicutes bacterium ADurb.Bin506]
MNAPEQLIQTIHRASDILLCTHVLPDGDAIGSLLGLKAALEAMGKNVTAALSDEVPPYLRFLPGADDIKPVDCMADSFPLAIVLDCGALDRVGRCMAAVEASRLTINIDHHATNSGFAAMNWVNVDSGSTAEMIYALITQMGVAISPEAATCLFAGISTDTGSFRYSSTTAETFRAAAALTEAGASPWRVSQSIYDTKSYDSLAGMAEAILGMKFECSGLVASMDITAELMARHKLTESETEGFISYARSVAGVEVAVAFKEVHANEIRVGLRSNRKVDVARVALALGGGGHVRASGLTFRGSLDQARPAVMAGVKKALREAGFTWTD